MTLFDFYRDILETYADLFPEEEKVDKCEVIDIAEEEVKNIKEDKQISKELYYSTLQSLFSYSMTEKFFKSKNNELNYFIKTVNEFLSALDLKGFIFKVDFQRTYNSDGGKKSWTHRNAFSFSNLKKKDLEDIFRPLEKDFVISFSPDLVHDGVEVVLKEKKKLPRVFAPKFTKEDFLKKILKIGEKGWEEKDIYRLKDYVQFNLINNKVIDSDEEVGLQTESGLILFIIPGLIQKERLISSLGFKESFFIFPKFGSSNPTYFMIDTRKIYLETLLNDKNGEEQWFL